MTEYIDKINELPSHRMDDHSKTILKSAIRAVNNLEAWSELSKFTPREDHGFMWEDHPFVNKVTSEVSRLYDGHSGCSMGWTMRQVEYIAKNGIDSYVELFQ